MNPKRIIPAAETKIEIKVSNSIFIATASPAFSVEEAKQFISRIRETYHDATHNVPIYIIGHPPAITEHSNDDGEPSGTAGRPALSVLRGSGVGDIAIVISRYFGGTKLGTGGLVRAYSDAVREVLKVIPKAQKVSTIITHLNISYSFYEQFKQLVLKFNGKIFDQEFGTDVRVKINLREDAFQEFKNLLLEKSNGQISAEIYKTNPNTIMPILNQS